MNDNFTTAARAEAERDWGTTVRAQRPAFIAGAEWARDHLAAQEDDGHDGWCGCGCQEPTAAERAVRELHHEREWRQLDGTYIGGTVCNACRRPYPCPTISVLDRDRAALTAAKEARHG